MLLRHCLVPARLTCLGILIQTSAVLAAEWSFEAQRMALNVKAGEQQHGGHQWNPIPGAFTRRRDGL